MISSVNSSTSQYQSQVSSTEELTDEQKKKIAEIEAKFEAKKITETEKDQQIAEVKASGVKAKQKKNVTENNAEKVQEKSTADAAAAQAKAAAEASKKLSELLKNKETGQASDDDLKSFLENLKEDAKSSEGTLVDEKV